MSSVSPITRTSLEKCKTKGCPFTPEDHVNWCGHNGTVTHLHWPKKGMGGKNRKSKIEALACWPCHDKIDNFGGAVFIEDIKGQGKTVWATDLRGNELFSRILGADRAAAEACRSSMTEPPSGTLRGDAGSSPAGKGSAAAPSASGKGGDMEMLSPSYNETGLSLPEGLSYDEWYNVGQTLSQMTRCLAWWWGDWLNYGESQYGETYSQAINITGKDYSTVSDWRWVAKAVESSARAESLSWSHHRVIASLGSEEQGKWLARAEEENWSHPKLREELVSEGLLEPRVKRLVEPPEVDLFEVLKCPGCGYRGERPEFQQGKETT